MWKNEKDNCKHKSADENAKDHVAVVSSRGEVEASFFCSPGDSATSQLQEEVTGRTHKTGSVPTVNLEGAHFISGSPRASSVSGRPQMSTRGAGETARQEEKRGRSLNTWEMYGNDEQDSGTTAGKKGDSKKHRAWLVKKLDPRKSKKNRSRNGSISSLTKDVRQEPAPAMMESGLGEEGEEEEDKAPTPELQRPADQIQPSPDSPSSRQESSVFSGGSSNNVTCSEPPKFDEKERQNSLTIAEIVLDRAKVIEDTEAAEKKKQQNIAKIRKADEKLIEAVGKYKSQVKEIQSQLEAEQLKNEQQAKEIAALQQEKDEANAALLRVATTAPKGVGESVKEQFDSLKSENEKLAERAYTAETDMQKTESLQKQVDHLTKQLAAAEAEVIDKTNEVDEMAALIISTKPGEALQDQAEFEKLRELLKQMKEEITSLKKTVEQLRAPDQTLHFDREENTGAEVCEQRTEELTKALEEASDAMAQVSEKDATIQRLNAEISAKDRQIEELQHKVSTGSHAQEFEDEVDDLKKDLACMEDLLQAEELARKKDLHDAAATESELEVKVEELKEELRNAQTQLQPELMNVSQQVRASAIQFSVGNDLSEELREKEQLLEDALESRQEMEAEHSGTVRHLQAEVKARDELLELIKSTHEGSEQDAFKKVKQQYLKYHLEVIQLKTARQEYESQQHPESPEGSFPLCARSLSHEDSSSSGLSSSAQLQQLKVALEVKNRHISNMETTFRDFESTLKEHMQMKEHQTVQSKKIAELKEELKQAKETIAHLQEEEHALKGEVGAARENVANANTTAGQEKHSVKIQLEDATARADRLQTELEVVEWQSRCSKLEDERTELSGKLKQAEDTVKELHERNDHDIALKIQNEEDECRKQQMQLAHKNKELLHENSVLKNEQRPKLSQNISHEERKKERKKARKDNDGLQTAEIAGRYEQMMEHSRGQSKKVLELKAKLQASESTTEKATEATPPSVGGSSDVRARVGKLGAELKEAREINDRARLFDNRVVSLTEDVSLKEQEIESLRSQMKDYAITKSHSDHELQQSIERLKEENAQLKLGQDDPDGREALTKQTSSSAKLAQEVISLQRLLKQRENELQVLKARVAMDGEDSPVKNPSRIIPKALTTSSRSKSAGAVLGDQTDPQLVGKDSLQPLAVPGRAVTDGGGTELASLLQELTEKDAKVAKLAQQLQKMEEASGRMAQIFDHSRMQSKTIADLKQQLKDTESATEKATEATPPSLGGSSDEGAGLKVEVKRLQEQVSQYGQLVRSANFDKQRLSKILESYRQQFEKVVKEKSVVEQARSDLEQKNVALQAQVVNLTESVSTAQNKATQLAAKLEGLDQELERLRKQNQELLGETEDLRINLTTFEEDFKQKRGDRQNTRSKMNKMEARHISEMDDVKKSLELTQRDLKHHKAHLRNTEQLLVSQTEQLQKELDSREAEISSLSEAKQSLEQDMMSKSQQVKQCRKQVELYEAELKGSQEQMTAYKNQVEDLRKQDEKQKKEISNQAQQFQLQRNEIESLQKENGNLQTQLQVKQEFKPLPHGAQNAQGMERGEEELARYRITSYQPLKEDGFSAAGSYGSVHRVLVSNIPCIAKKILDILVGRNREEVVSKDQKQAIKLRFQKECVLLSRMRHPTIVQFMGVCYPNQDPLDLTLIMEFLPMDLEKCLKKYPNLPLPIKLSILLDVSYGLLHLHNASIIHRDLSAANVLLTPDMRAKITDFGVSKILEVHPLQMSKQSALPGALGYMPPEALWETPLYGTKLDVFSFGVVALFVAVQQYPQFYEIAGQETVDIQIKKRQKWIRMLPGKGSRCLHDLIIQCLQDKAAQRPTTEHVNLTLKQLSQDHPRELTDIVQLEQELAKQNQEVVSLVQEREHLKKQLADAEVQRIPSAVVFPTDPAHSPQPPYPVRYQQPPSAYGTAGDAQYQAIPPLLTKSTSMPGIHQMQYATPQQGHYYSTLPRAQHQAGHPEGRWMGPPIREDPDFSCDTCGMKFAVGEEEALAEHVKTCDIYQ